MSAEELEGLLFDGRTAAATPVRVKVGDGRLHVTTAGGEPLHAVPLGALAVTDPLASAPRQVTLGGGAVVEIADGPALTAALAAAGYRGGLVDRLQQRWPAAVASLVLSVAILALGYAYGLPAAVRAASALLPAGAERRIGEGILEVLDGGLLAASTLSEAERSGAERRIAEAARLGAPGRRYRLLFRSTGMKPGANAFALPGGTVVLLDELVRRTGGDDRLVAVVGHELGHDARHHSTQALLKGLGVGAFATLLWGDFSGQAASVSTLFAMLRYSREAEREADEDAVRFLRAAGRSARPMLDALCLLADVEREAGAAGIPAALSTHPKMEERLARVAALGGFAAGDAACPAPPAAPLAVPQASEGADVGTGQCRP